MLTKPLRSLHRRAFTLIELMVVTMLIVVLMTSAIFIIGSGTRAEEEAKSLCRRLGGTLEDAKRFRDLHSAMAWIVYDFDNQTVTFYRERELEADETLEDVRNYPEEYQEQGFVYQVGDPDNPESSPLWLSGVQDFDGTIYDEGVFTVRFDPDGSGIGHIAYIDYAADGEENEFSVMSVELNPVTGIAAVYEFYKELEEGSVP